MVLYILKVNGALASYIRNLLSSFLSTRKSHALQTLSAQNTHFPNIMDSWTSLRLQDQKVYCHVLQDIDAAYIFDDNSDLDASLSALLEVPSLDMAQFDARPVSNATGGNTSGSQLTVGKTS